VPEYGTIKLCGSKVASRTGGYISNTLKYLKILVGNLKGGKKKMKHNLNVMTILNCTPISEKWRNIK
jgi:hypothetical protein